MTRKLTLMISIFGLYLSLGNEVVAESTLADLHKGKLIIPCTYVILDAGDNEQDMIAVNVMMAQQGSSINWKVTGAVVLEEGVCPVFVPPENTAEQLQNAMMDEQEDNDEKM